MVICLEQVADLHMAQLMPLPLTVSCFSKIQIGSTFLVLAHLGSPGNRAIKRMCVCIVWAGCPSHHPSDTDLASGIVKGGGGCRRYSVPRAQASCKDLGNLGCFLTGSNTPV